MQETDVQELLDRKACEDVLLRYGRTLDWLDDEGQAQCFWPDAEIDYGFFKGSGEEWLPVVMAAEEGSMRRWHISTGIMVSVRGERASSECYGLSMGAVPGEDGELVTTLFGGRYLDEFEKRDGQWRIARRKYIADWAHSFPDGLKQLAESGFDLNVLDITAPGHGDYRTL